MYKCPYKINENRDRHKSFYHNNKNGTIGSVADTNLSGVYWDEMGILSLGEDNPPSIAFL